jgi:hypothetical protein
MNNTMTRHLFPSLVAAVAVTMIGCERKTVDIDVVPPTPASDPVAQTKTLETARLGSSVDDYERTPSAENLADVKKALAELDGEIAELEGHVANRTGREREEASAKLKNLQAYRVAETARFAAAQAKASPGVPPSVDARSGAEKVEDTAKRVGNTIENAAKETGDAIKDAVR